MSTSKLNKAARPHRRLSLTMPTEAPVAAPAEDTVETPVVEPETESAPAAKPARRAVAKPVATTEDAQTVRVMSYLTEDEAALLDELWLQFRRLPQRPSKSDIMRAALALGGQDRDALIDVITSQQVSTLTRQRNSKISKPAS